MNKKKILISFLSFIAVINLFNYDVINISLEGIIINLNNFTPIFNSIISLYKNIFF